MKQNLTQQNQHVEAPKQRLYSRRQLAERWACSTETIKRRERQNLLRRCHVIGRARYSIEAIEEYERKAEAK
jgi:hypothetical protein